MTDDKKKLRLLQDLAFAYIQEFGDAFYPMHDGNACQHRIQHADFVRLEIAILTDNTESVRLYKDSMYRLLKKDRSLWARVSPFIVPWNREDFDKACLDSDLMSKPKRT